MLAVQFHSVGEFVQELGYNLPKCCGVARLTRFTQGYGAEPMVLVGFRVMVPREGEVLVLDLSKVVTVRKDHASYDLQAAALKSYLADVEAALKQKGLDVRGGSYKTI